MPRSQTVLLLRAAPLTLVMLLPIARSVAGEDGRRLLETGTVACTDLQERIIYHSPQTPGWTSWVGLAKGRGNHLYLTFTEITGDVKRPGDVRIML